eukprot:jgi/Hompol1/2313/HPOL_001972-RA
MFNFGPWPIRASTEIFYASKLSLGLVNLKPIVPGHVMVISRRVVQRFKDLTSDEVSDLFLSAHEIAKVIEKQYAAESMSITIQDGPFAGQSVPHVHVHVIPRRKGDWLNNDDIYAEIDQKEAQLGLEIAKNSGDEEAAQKLERRARKIVPDSDRGPRTPQEMAEEAGVLRKLFNQPEDIWS